MKYVVSILFILSCFLLAADGGAKVETNSDISQGKYNLVDDKELKEKELLNDDNPLAEEDTDYIIWESDVHYLDHNFYIRQGEKLKIKPGTKVIITGNYSITVEAGGIIMADGNFNDPVTFAVDYDNDFNFGESNRSRSLEYWQGFKFLNGGSKDDISKFTYCDFTRIQANTDDSKGRSTSHDQKLFYVEGDCTMIFDNCKFTENNYHEEDFIYIKYSNIEFRNCIFKNNNTGIRLENSFLTISNTTIANNSFFDLNLYRVGTTIDNCVILNNQNFNLLIREKQILKITNSNFTNNSNPQKPLVLVDDLKNAVLENSCFIDNSNLALECNDTELKLSRCLIKGQSQTPALYFNSKTGKKITTLVNCSIADNGSTDKSICQIGNNIILIIINSVFMNNGTADFDLITQARNSTFYAFNSVISQKKAIRSKNTKFKTLWNSIIAPQSIADLHDYKLIDQGWDKYYSGEQLIFEYSPSQYIGTAPDIGYYEE